MHSIMDLELLNYINLDLKWNMAKKGRRSVTRRPRKSETGSFDLVNKIQSPDVFETKKSGVDVLGRRLAEKVIDAPLKKRRLLRLSPSPPPKTPCLSGERALSPGRQTPSLHEDSGLHCRSNSPSMSQETKSKTGLRSGYVLKLTEKDDFSGIELLAAAACSSFIHDNAEEHTSPGVNSCAVDAKETIVTTESDDSLVQENVAPDTKKLVDNANKGGEKRLAPSKGFRLHWDLNTAMDEWEEPYENCSEEVYNDGFKSVKLNLEVSENRCSEAVGAEERSTPDSVCTNQLSGKHDAAIAHEVIEDLTCSGDVLDTKIITSKTSETSDGESFASKSDVVDSSIHSGKFEDSSTSITSLLREQAIVKGESDTMEPKNTISKSDCQPVSEDPLSDCGGSNVTQDEQGHMAEGDTMDKVEAGYDSPFEDGELREPIRWEEINEVEEKAHVYYESDNIYDDDLGTVECRLSEKNEFSHECNQTMEDRSLLFVKEVEAHKRLEVVPNNDIEQDAKVVTLERPHGSKASTCRLNLEESDSGYGKRKNGRNESTSFDACRNVANVRQRSWDLRPEKFMAREKVSFQGCDRRMKSVVDSNQSRNYNPRGGYRTFSRRPSPSERNDGYVVHRGPLVRSVSRDGFRGAPGFHPDPCYLERKPRFSPNFNRPKRRSRSRSRSGSPIAWHFQKQKNLDTKSQTPPDHEARFQKASLSGGIEGGFVNVRSSRCFDDRKFMDGQFRGKRPSPVAVIRRNQRFDPIGSDDRIRLSRPPGRFSQMTEQKQDEKYEKLNRVRCSGDAGGVRRFRYTVDDSFEEAERVVPESTSKAKGTNSHFSHVRG